MATQPKDLFQHYFSPDEYFALEHAGNIRYEYWDGDIFCMSGGSRAHIQICGNVFFHLRRQLGRGTCRAFTAEMPIKTPALPPYRYPDASVACGDLAFENMRGVDVLLNPVLIVEVMSPTSAARDQEDKFTAYQKISSFSDYLLIAQDAPRAILYTRQTDGASLWQRRDVNEAHASLAIDSIASELSMNDIYENVEFS